MNRPGKILKQAVFKRVKVKPSQRYAGQVGLYTAAMLRELDANVYKGDYLKLEQTALLLELQKHLDKLRLTTLNNPQELTRILEFAADMGNLAFFVADKAGALTIDTLEKREKESDYNSAY